MDLIERALAMPEHKSLDAILKVESVPTDAPESIDLPAESSEPPATELGSPLPRPSPPEATVPSAPAAPAPPPPPPPPLPPPPPPPPPPTTRVRLSTRKAPLQPVIGFDKKPKPKAKKGTISLSAHAAAMSSSTEEVRTLRRLVEELEAYTTELKGQVVRLEEQLIVLRRVRSPRRVARDNARLDQVEAAVLHQRIASLLDENIALSSSNAALVEHARKCPNCGALHNVRARTAITSVSNDRPEECIRRSGLYQDERARMVALTWTGFAKEEPTSDKPPSDSRPSVRTRKGPALRTDGPHPRSLRTERLNELQRLANDMRSRDLSTTLRKVQHAKTNADGAKMLRTLPKAGPGAAPASEDAPVVSDLKKKLIEVQDARGARPVAEGSWRPELHLRLPMPEPSEPEIASGDEDDGAFGEEEEEEEEEVGGEQDEDKSEEEWEESEAEAEEEESEEEAEEEQQEEPLVSGRYSDGGGEEEDEGATVFESSSGEEGGGAEEEEEEEEEEAWLEEEEEEEQDGGEEQGEAVTVERRYKG